MQPRGTPDVVEAVRFARAHELELAVKGGGHNVAGHAATDGGLMLDLSAAMTSVRVDPTAGTAVVEPGALLGDLDRATQAHGLATPAGFIATTGIAGLTLGGGFGYLSRKHGLTVDNLRAVELVTAAGDVVRAGAEDNQEQFWAVRGGGGNFRVVSSFEFDLHPLGPEVLAGPVVHAFADAPHALRRVAEIMKEAPDEVACLTVIRHAPPAPFIPEQFHGELIVLFAVVHAGHPRDGEGALAPLRSVGDPIGDAVAPRPYAAFQSMFDATASAGARNYWKAHYLDELTPDAIDLMCDHAARMTSPESAIGMLTLGGAISRRREQETAYPHRAAEWVVNIQSRWRDPQEDDRHIAWSRGLFDALTPHATGGRLRQLHQWRRRRRPAPRGLR